MANLGTSFDGIVTGIVNESDEFRGIMYLVGVLKLGLFLLVPLIDDDKSKVQFDALVASDPRQQNKIIVLDVDHRVQSTISGPTATFKIHIVFIVPTLRSTYY